jgi:hypothetical protein
MENLFSTSGLGTSSSPQFPHSYVVSPRDFRPSNRFLSDWQRQYVNSAPPLKLSGLDFQFLPSLLNSDAQMISANNLSQSSHLHDIVGSSRHAKQHSEDSSISSPGFGQPESGHSDPIRENHGQPNLKRRVSEIESHEGMIASSKSVRRRISRACDQCNQLRTKVFGNPMGILAMLPSTD